VKIKHDSEVQKKHIMRAKESIEEVPKKGGLSRLST